VGLAGGVGAVARYLVDGAVQERTSGLFPFGTLTVNVVGSLILGGLAGWVLSGAGSAQVRNVLGAGFCGGLTTWSTASWEAIRLAEEGGVGSGARYTLANLGVSLVAGAAGLALFLA
jgi:CrcB protein